MSKLEKFRIFCEFFGDVLGCIIFTYFIIVISVAFVFGEGYAEDAFMRLATLLGLTICACLVQIKKLKDDWKKLKYVLKTLKNDGDNDDIYECEEHDDAYKDDAYKYDAYDGYDDEYDEEELEEKTIKERA